MVLFACFCVFVNVLLFVVCCLLFVGRCSLLVASLFVMSVLLLSAVRYLLCVV